jgi:transcriptional regulator with XRE-family HTH domain
MNELTEKLREEFHDKETREVYAEDFLNTYIATQIKTLREQAGWTQAELAERAGMKQERISILEDVNYSSWTANVLKRIAKAFDMRLSIKIESFGSYLDEFENFNREALLRPSFEQDPVFRHEQTAVCVGVVQRASEGLRNELAGKSDRPQGSEYEKSHLLIPKVRYIGDYKHEPQKNQKSNRGGLLNRSLEITKRKEA